MEPEPDSSTTARSGCLGSMVRWGFAGIGVASMLCALALATFNQVWDCSFHIGALLATLGPGAVVPGVLGLYLFVRSWSSERMWLRETVALGVVLLGDAYALTLLSGFCVVD